MESPIQPIQSPIQKILFGSPGTGKSWRIKDEIIPGLGIDESINPENVIRTVFHPEYTYGDFMGKLMPLTTKEKKVEYSFYEGHFLKALAQAYKNILSSQPGEKIKNVALVIDEINRGNSSAIFGTVFQLLDRDKNGWSDYGINLSEVELRSIVSLIGFVISGTDGDFPTYKYEGKGYAHTLEKHQDIFSKLNIKIKSDKIIGSCIRIPPNLSILGTMNTSDNSIYFMDSAFKRRWDWEFVNWDDSKPPAAEYGELDETQWKTLIKNLNEFIKKNHKLIRGIEDKQIGYYFIKTPVSADKIQNKLMFFLWDSVFNRDKQPLVKLLGVETDQLVTFGDFTKLHNQFIEKINAGEWRTKP